jgi:hypothetical protein
MALSNCVTADWGSPEDFALIHAVRRDAFDSLLDRAFAY